jgi:hypothetical protein
MKQEDALKMIELCLSAIEDALKMIELCLSAITDEVVLEELIMTVVYRRIEIALPKKREYKRKESIDAQPE